MKSEVRHMSYTGPMAKLSADLENLDEFECKALIKGILQGKKIYGTRDDPEWLLIKDLYNNSSAKMRMKINQAIHDLIIEWQESDEEVNRPYLCYLLSLIVVVLHNDEKIFNQLLSLAEGETLKGKLIPYNYLIDLHYEVLGALSIKQFRELHSKSRTLTKVCLRDIEQKAYFLPCYMNLFIQDVENGIRLFPKFVRFGMDNEINNFKSYFFTYRFLYQGYRKKIDAEMEKKILPALSGDEKTYFLNIWESIKNDEKKITAGKAV